MNTVTNTGATTNVIIQTATDVTFVTTTDVVIGGREWTLAITAQGITESAGATVTQGTGGSMVTGTLKTTLQNQWTLTIGAADITASVGVTVTQGSVTGTLATALTGVGMTSVVINTASTTTATTATPSVNIHTNGQCYILDNI